MFRYPASLRLSQTLAVAVRLVRDLESVLRPGRVQTDRPSFLAIVPFKTARAHDTVIHTDIISHHGSGAAVLSSCVFSVAVEWFSVVVEPGLGNLDA